MSSQSNAARRRKGAYYGDSKKSKSIDYATQHEATDTCPKHG
ncbi:hypothetical protein Tamer19_36970 [Cupriavidus sp. TA19]|nr:hypothetical protein Tamer19_36970 [Cupriavidus sp. TA19]